jgi:predicted XRE-type DNA-binding protein
MKPTNSDFSVTPTGGNIFADLGFDDAEEMKAKSILAIHIRRAIKARKLTQIDAAAVLGIDQPKVSAIINGKIDGFSTDRLMRFLNDLGCDVHLSVSAPHADQRGAFICGA